MRPTRWRSPSATSTRSRGRARRPRRRCLRRSRRKSGDELASLPAGRDRAPPRPDSREATESHRSWTSAASATTSPCRCRRSTASATPGGEVALRMHTHVREDALALYGFATTLELDLFERLIGISGIGPKVGARRALRHRAARAHPRDRARRPRAADGDSRRRQEDVRAHRPRAEGSPARSGSRGGGGRRRGGPPCCATICSRR